MNITEISSGRYSVYAPKGNSSVPKFTIPQLNELYAGNDNVKDNGITSVGTTPYNYIWEKYGIKVPKPDYTITEEEKEYFREKYGETYSEEAAGQFYYELAKKEIISNSDATGASDTIQVMPLSEIKRVIWIGPGPDIFHVEERWNNIIASKEYCGETIYPRDTNLTFKDDFKSEWEYFKNSYGKKTETWEDELQLTLDFEHYLKEIAKNSTSGKKYPSQEQFDKIIESLEKTKDIISQIFG